MLALDHLIAFERRQDESASSPAGDGLGNHEGAWEEIFRAHAAIQFLRGGEQVLAQRLTGVQPCVVTIRRSSSADAVDPSWRARDVRAPQGRDVINIRSVAPNKDAPRLYLDLLCEIGAAV